MSRSRTRATSTTSLRPVLYQLGRVDDRFVPGDAPIDLSIERRPLVLSRKDDDSVAERGRILVDDPWMSGQHARIVDGPARTGVASLSGQTPSRLFVEDCGSKNGVVVNGALIQRAPLLHGDVIETGRTFWVYVEERDPAPLLTSAIEVGAFVSWHPRLGAQLQELLSRARGDEHALIVGEDGTGKGFLARTLHQISRRDGRFLHLDCAERRPRKLAVDLFGKDGVGGRLRDAAGGTLLLEHVETLPLDLQLRLADVLVRRMGGREARVLATCSASPEQLLLAGTMDASLVAALSGIRVDVPPLHERLCDLGLLLDDFITRAKGATAVTRDACRVLFRHRFAQNVRGFARVVEAAASLAVDDDHAGVQRPGSIDVQHLPFAVAGLDAVRAMIARANLLAAGEVQGPGPGELHDPNVRTSAEVPVLSETGEQELLAASMQMLSEPFSSSIETATELPRPFSSSSSAQPRRPATVSVLDAGVFAEPDELDGDAVVAAMHNARGNVAAAARALGRPRALVLRWVRELGLDPLSFT
jgi:DNA-binding NtrC family response regulator